MQVGPWDVHWEWPRLAAGFATSNRLVSIYRRWVWSPIWLTGVHYSSPWWLHSNFVEWRTGLNDRRGRLGRLICLFQYEGFSLWWITRPYCWYARIDQPPRFYEIRTLWLRWGFYGEIKDGDYKAEEAS